MAKWTHAEKAISDTLFPHRITLAVNRAGLLFYGINWASASVGQDTQGFIGWIVDHIGYPIKPDQTFKQWCRMNRKPDPKFNPNHDYRWMMRATGPSAIRIYFKDASMLVAFKLRFSEAIHKIDAERDRRLSHMALSAANRKRRLRK